MRPNEVRESRSWLKVHLISLALDLGNVGPVELVLSRGRNAVAIYQDLVDKYGFASSYQSVQRFVRQLRGTQTPEARVVITTPPGQEAQVDYGTGPMVRDPETRKYRRTRLFVMTLGCSGTPFAC